MTRRTSLEWGEAILSALANTASPRAIAARPESTGPGPWLFSRNRRLLVLALHPARGPICNTWDFRSIEVWAPGGRQSHGLLVPASAAAGAFAERGLGSAWRFRA